MTTTDLYNKLKREGLEDCDKESLNYGIMEPAVNLDNPGDFEFKWMVERAAQKSIAITFVVFEGKFVCDVTFRNTLDHHDATNSQIELALRDALMGLIEMHKDCKDCEEVDHES